MKDEWLDDLMSSNYGLLKHILVSVIVTAMIKPFVMYCETSQRPGIEPSLSLISVSAAISKDNNKRN